MKGIHRYLMLFCIGLMLTACEKSSDPVNLFPLPKQLQQRLLPDGVVLKGVAKISELGMETEMDIKNDQATGFFSNLPAGTYTVEVTFSDVVKDVVLATAKRPVEIGHSAGELAFGKDDYDYPDSDGDKYSNLDEIRVKKNPADPGNFPIPHRVFITSIEGPGDLSRWGDAGGSAGLLAGDAICKSLAQNTGLTGEYRAWLSDKQNDAYCRVAGGSGKKGSNTCNPKPEETKSYVNTGGEAIAESLDQLVGKGQMFHAIRFDESRANLRATVWTGTTAKGAYAEGSKACNGWNSLDGSGMYGDGETTTGSWTASFRKSCGDSSLRLYCFQISSADHVLPIYKTRSAKKVFLSSTEGTGDLSSWPEAQGKSGVLAGDKICQTLASNAGYANAEKFIAWLTDSSTSAIDRLVGEGQWARPDGVLVVNNRADLLDGTLLTGIAQTEKGAYIGHRAWTGTEYEGGCTDCISALSCENWSSASSSIIPKHGLSSSTSYGWSDLGESWNSHCSDTGRLYCFEGE
jgi:hypothetical protein